MAQSQNTNFIGLQTQSDKNRTYNGPFDAMKKIYSAHGIAGIYKGQAVTLLREATGYGVYFLAYEKLMQREMAQKGIKREEISPVHAVLYGATAGYAVCPSHIMRHLHHLCLFPVAVGCHIPNRHGEISTSNGWILAFDRPEIQICH